MRACGSRAEQLRCLSCRIFVRIKESVIRSAMSSPCWSPPQFLSSSLPQHEAPPGQHDLLQEDTVHPEPLSQEPLPKTTWSESNAKEPLSHINYDSGGNLRPNTPTGYEPNELTTKELTTIPTISGSSLGDIYQLYDVQREFGEQDQAPVIEEVKEFGQIQAQSLLDHEMAQISLAEKMFYVQFPDAPRRVHGKHCGL